MTTGVGAPFLVTEAVSPSVGGRSSDAIPTGQWAWTLVLLLAATAYVDSLGYEFVWDDATMIPQNPGLRHPHFSMTDVAINMIGTAIGIGINNMRTHFANATRGAAANLE